MVYTSFQISNCDSNTIMGSCTDILNCHIVLLLMFTHSSVADSCKNETLFPCLNDGKCVLDKCVCQSGFSGSTCSNSSGPTNVVVLLLIGILPLITWTIVCCYGCSNLRKTKARRRLRQLQVENQAGLRDLADGIPLHDDPPCYDQAVYSNPITISGLDENTDWTLQGEDTLIPPPHYDDLKFIHKHLMDLGDGVHVEDGSSSSQQGSEVIQDADTIDETMLLESASHSSFLVSTDPSQPNISTDSSQPNITSDAPSLINKQEVAPSQLSQISGIEGEEMDEKEEGNDTINDDGTEDIDE
ncbi:uncharacterized protein LOC117304085 isoform X2 [Asterias rubens]|uniref:uncharacterized protein LOC117304085 isoform X2 n=1 Tax=Asterias rubens TaxID=7604 RepID=UPI0014554F42|nr:uncharacterized protein LOC117304085 isoform X2 [Asterias rubens]